MPSPTPSQHSNAYTQPWIDWTNLTLGVFFAASPWLALGDGYAATVNALTCGVIIALAAGAALDKASAGAQWTNVVLGFWLLIAPGVLGFSDSVAAMWTSVLVGLGVAGFAGFQLSEMSRSGRH